MNIDKAQDVKKILQMIEPAMEADGGGISAFEIVDDTIRVKLKGTCLFCPSFRMTLKHGIERTLKVHLPWVKEVIPYTN